MPIRSALVLVFACCAGWLGCERKATGEPLAERRLQLLQEEHARLVAEVAKQSPGDSSPTVIPPEASVQDKITKLTDANERLRELYRSAEREQSAAFNLAQRQQIERDVEEIRGLKFKRAVDYSVLGRQDIKGALTKRLNAVFSDEEFEEQANALFRIGLMPEKYPLKERLVALLGEQVAAFYDQHEHRLYMYDDATLEKPMNRMILAHELMHAMQDQHISLKALPLEEKRNDDRAVAAASLIEGEATLVMSDYMVRNPSAQMVLDNLSAVFVQNMEELAKAPRILRESLIFPYQDGLTFCLAGFQRRGWMAISDAYQRPPNSTTQILHPEKFYRQREDPIEVQWPDVKFRGKAPSWDNVLGELGARILFADWLDADRARDAAAGWRGDRYLSFDAGDTFVWKSIWASAEEAAEFFRAETELLARRYKAKPQEPSAGRWEATSPRVVRVIATKGSEVLVIDAGTAEAADALEAQFGK